MLKINVVWEFKHGLLLNVLMYLIGGLALCLRGSTEERGQIIFDMVNLAK